MSALYPTNSLRCRTASPAVAHRVTTFPAPSISYVQAGRGSPSPQLPARQISQSQITLQSPSSSKSQLPSKRKDEMKNSIDVAELQMDSFAAQVEELQEELNYCVSGKSDHSGSFRFPTRMQSQPASGHRSKIEGLDSNGFWPETESQIKAAVDAKVAMVLDVALQKFNSFAVACLQRFNDELEKDREQQNQAIQEQFKQLRSEVDALKIQAGQAPTKEPALTADTGASPSDNSGLPTIYEHAGAGQRPPQPITSPFSKQRDADVHAIIAKLREATQDVKLRDADVSSIVRTEPLLADSKKKWEKLLEVEDLVAKGKERFEQVVMNTAANGKPRDSTPEQMSPRDSRASKKFGELPDAAGSKFPLPGKAAVPVGGDSPSRVAYWDQSKIGVWYSQTSKFVRDCNDPNTAHQTIQQRWASAEAHIPPGLRPILLSGLEEMKMKVAGYFERQKPSRSPSREWETVSSHSI